MKPFEEPVELDCSREAGLLESVLLCSQMHHILLSNLSFAVFSSVLYMARALFFALFGLMIPSVRQTRGCVTSPNPSSPLSLSPFPPMFCPLPLCGPTVSNSANCLLLCFSLSSAHLLLPAHMKTSYDIILWSPNPCVSLWEQTNQKPPASDNVLLCLLSLLLLLWRFLVNL